ERVAVRLDDTVLTYPDLAERSARAASLIRNAGVAPGDRVAVMLPNLPEFAVVYYGILRAGGVVVPMNPLLKEREVGYYLSDGEAQLIVAASGCAEQSAAAAARMGAVHVTVDTGFDDLLATEPSMDGIADRADGDTAVILYTSGTTGQPKGAELTHGNLAANVSVAATDLFRLAPGDVIFGGLPLFHSFGQTCGLNAALGAGACLTLWPRFAPAGRV